MLQKCRPSSTKVTVNNYTLRYLHITTLYIKKLILPFYKKIKMNILSW